MAIEIKKKEGETVGSFLYRFNKRVQHSGLVKETRKRQFQARPSNRRKRREGALYRMKKQKELAQTRKRGA
jgi:ribosomal protein S21